MRILFHQVVLEELIHIYYLLKPHSNFGKATPLCHIIIHSVLVPCLQYCSHSSCPMQLHLNSTPPVSILLPLPVNSNIQWRRFNVFYGSCNISATSMGPGFASSNFSNLNARPGFCFTIMQFFSIFFSLAP